MIMDYRLPLEIVVTSSILIVSNVGLRLEVCVLSVTKNGTSRRLNVFLATVNLQVEETKTKKRKSLVFYQKEMTADGVKIRPTKNQNRKEMILNLSVLRHIHVAWSILVVSSMARDAKDPNLRLCVTEVVINRYIP